MAAGIIGLGGYLPAGILTNDELAQRFDVTPQWIFERTGIRQRHVAAEGETTGDLAVHAALRALEAGFTDVIWYRGGSDAWKGASLPMAPARTVSW